ncbi:MAG: hypothetical protein LBS42_03245 [Tannerella sp.]|nr:hypothetical protein [Tannerella sp.]
MTLTLNPCQLEYLSNHYDGCLCHDCLMEIKKRVIVVSG